MQGVHELCHFQFAITQHGLPVAEQQHLKFIVEQSA